LLSVESETYPPTEYAIAVAFAKAVETESAFRVTFVKNSMLRLPLAVVDVEESGAPIPWEDTGCWALPRTMSAPPFAAATVVVEADSVIVTVLTSVVAPAESGMLTPAELEPSEIAPAAAYPKVEPRFDKAAPALVSIFWVEGSAADDDPCQDDDLASPTRIPPGTMIRSKSTATRAFLERMVSNRCRLCDEGLSERSDKSIYD